MVVYQGTCGRCGGVITVSPVTPGQDVRIAQCPQCKVDVICKIES